MEFPGDIQVLLHVLFGEMRQQPAVYEVSAEYVRILGQPDVRQPLCGHPAVVQLRDVRVFTEVRLAQLLYR